MACSSSRTCNELCQLVNYNDVFEAIGSVANLFVYILARICDRIQQEHFKATALISRGIMGSCDSLANFYQSSFPLVSTITGIVLALLSPLTVCLNALLMASFIATKQVYINATNFLMMCLCLSDLLNGAVALPLLAYAVLHNHSTNNCSTVMIAQIASFLFPVLSGIITLLIAIDRYLNMNPNLDRRSRCYKLFQRPYLYRLLTFLSISILVLSLAGRLMLYYVKTVEPKHLAMISLGSVVLLAIAVYAIAALYIKGYIRIRKFTEASPLYTERNGKAVRPQYVRSLYRSVLVLVIIMLLIYVPICLTHTAVSVYTFTASHIEHFVVILCYNIIGLLMYLNCIVNSLVILWFNKVAKQWVLNKMKCNLRRRTHTVNFANEVVNIHAVGQEAASVTEKNL